RTSFTELLVGMKVQAALPKRVSTVELPLLAIMAPLVRTDCVWMPWGDRQCIAFMLKVNELRSLGRQSIFARPMGCEYSRGTSTFICFWMKLIAAVHCAAVAVQLEAGMKLPVGSVRELLRMRFWPGKLRLV